jgi:hypothetical protein
LDKQIPSSSSSSSFSFSFPKKLTTDLLLQKQLVQEDLLHSKRRRAMIEQHGGTLEQNLLSHALEDCPKPSEKKKLASSCALS